jgi:di/tricarboxylate transporter
MNPHLLITLIIAGAAMVLLLTERLRADLVALLVVVALGTSGVLTSEETFSGFSRSAVITLLAIFILAAGLERTGVTQRVGDLLVRVAGRSEQRLVIAVMLAGAFLSLFMNNIAAGAVLLPAVSGASKRSGVNPSRLLMPLAFGTILGGMATLLTTTNIVVSSLLLDRGLPGYGLLDFASLGIPLVAAGIAYMALWGRRQLPARSPVEIFEDMQRQEANLAEIYHLGETLARAGIPEGSRLAGQTLAGSRLRETYGVNVLAIEREERVVRAPAPDETLRAGDILLLSGELGRSGVAGDLDPLPPRHWRERDLESRSVVLVEAVLSPRSDLIGRTLGETRFRDRYGMSVIALWRAGRSLRTGLTDLPLQLGDGLLLQGERGRLPVLRAEPDLIVLDRGVDEPPPSRRRGRLALLVMIASLVLAAISHLGVGEVMLGGALVMILIGALSMDDAYQAIEWRSVFLVAGMLPLGTAMTKTGAADLITHGLLQVLGGAGPLALLAGLIALAVLLTQAMNGAAVAAVLAPIAIQTAQRIGADPRSFAMGVALATSFAFLTPLGSPVNILVMGPGGYRFRDYFRAGLPLVLLLFALLLGLLPLVWPLTPRLAPAPFRTFTSSPRGKVSVGWMKGCIFPAPSSPPGRLAEMVEVDGGHSFLLQRRKQVAVIGKNQEAILLRQEENRGIRQSQPAELLHLARLGARDILLVQNLDQTPKNCPQPGYGLLSSDLRDHIADLGHYIRNGYNFLELT